MVDRENEEEGFGWENYRRYVVSELKNLREDSREAKEAAERVNRSLDVQIGGLRGDIQALNSYTRVENTSMKVQIAMLQVKSGVWGICGGLGTVAVALLVAWASGKL